MKRSMSLVLVVAIAMLAALPAAAQMRALSDPVVAHPDPESLFTSKDKQLHRNKQAALRIMRELLQCNQWDRAGEWLTDRYIQHNPMAASGLAGVKRYFIEVAKRKPTPTCTKLTSPVVAVQAEGDYVTVLIVREYPYADDPTKSYTTTWFDTWRFVDGKADEHWDPATLPAPPPPAASAPATRPASVLAGTLEDRAAIEKLMWSYDRALDTYNPDAYVTKFTADGAFGRTVGREALHKMVADLRKGRDDRIAKGEKVPAMRHFTMNQYLEFTSPTTARYHYYHQTVFGSGGPAGSPDAPRVAASGNGVDDLVKVDGQWLIKYRNVAATDDM
jgi:predicted SnoaL-like aldol condensation-catalyzing enzyme